MCAPLYKVVDSTKLEFYTRRVYCFWLRLRVVSFLLQVNMIDFFLSDQLTSQVSSHFIGPLYDSCFSFLTYIFLTSDTSDKKFRILHLLL